MVKSYVEDKNSKLNSGMLTDLISYICAPNDIIAARDRHDFIKPKDKDAFFDEMSEILNPKNAPLGKWPSRYMPALMQQVAINLTTSNENSGIFTKSGNIFSVNGPPGTGKTTLLKEIIASNIVNKAIVLSKYTIPDDAFEGKSFECGPLNGAYNEYQYKWYRFKDNSIADYGVLVTSCNNAAVENITKELPLQSGILENLKPVTEGDNRDSKEMQEQLREIRELFSAKETDNTGKGEPGEIYFTKYAKNLLSSEKKNIDAWGTVAVALGKKSNISNFYYKVLSEIQKNHLKKNDYIEKRLPEYQEARRIFLSQLKKVEGMRKELAKYGDAVSEARKALKNSQRTSQIHTERIQITKLQITNLETELEFKEPKLENDRKKADELNIVCTEIEQRIQKHLQEIKSLSEKEEDYKRQAKDAEQSISRLTKIFKKSKYNEALETAKSLREKAARFEDASFDVEKTLIDEQAKLAVENAKRDESEHQFKRLKDEIDSIKTLKTDLEIQCSYLQKEIQTAKDEAKALAQKRDSLLEQYAQAGELKSGHILDEDFIESILSKDENVSTIAQTTNPWTTEEYNREREKLFFYALQMTKEFLLSSKCCRANLRYLGQYWGLKLEGSNKVNFHTNDKEAMIDSLLNTLFLLTPVISSTFASVGNLLKDIKKPGVIGTLIIDEAGQAQPQMAVGALFRARKSIIVGDPKQVEPVVTDDLKILKNSYSKTIFARYNNKSLSVQSCADIINPFGTFFDNDNDSPEWVGCPLLVHRRCISPMYEISNRISYDGIMKQQTLPPSEKKAKTFLSTNSCWINIIGTETGNGNHYVPKQGELVCRMIDKAFKLAEQPNLYIITPFTSVEKGIRDALENYKRKTSKEHLKENVFFDDWVDTHIGTVHKFQGKEANEVIFVLGCDETAKKKYAVTGFVNSNIVNVAATRAKYRFYVIGDIRVWRNNQYVKEAKGIIDTLPIENIFKIDCWEDSEEKEVALQEQLSKLPKASSFASVISKNEGSEREGQKEIDYEIITDEFIAKIDQNSFFEKTLSNEQYQQFGFLSKEEFEKLPTGIKKNLLMGMKLYFFFKPIFSTETTKDSDVSFCGILFCKAMELYLKQNFVTGLKTRFPDYEIKTASKQLVKLQNASPQDFMIGTIQYILRNKVEEIGRYMALRGEDEYSTAWWKSFNDKLKLFAEKRNKCCHHQVFKWHDMEQLIKYEFEDDVASTTKEPKIGGVFYESKNGEKLGK
jgi:hypothetical protein